VATPSEASIAGRDFVPSPVDLFLFHIAVDDRTTGLDDLGAASALHSCDCVSYVSTGDNTLNRIRILPRERTATGRQIGEPIAGELGLKAPDTESGPFGFVAHDKMRIFKARYEPVAVSNDFGNEPLRNAYVK